MCSSEGLYNPGNFLAAFGLNDTSFPHLTRPSHIRRLTGRDAGTTATSTPRNHSGLYARMVYPSKPTAALFVDSGRPAGANRGKGFACSIADDLQFEQTVSRASSCSRSGGVAVLASMPSIVSRICQGAMRRQWGHRNTTIVTVGSSTKVEGVLTAVHPTSLAGIFNHSKETNTNWKCRGKCELYAPETKCTRRAAILAHNAVAC